MSSVQELLDLAARLASAAARETCRACLWMVESYERSRSKGERATSAIVLKITSVQPSPTVEVFGSSDIALPENVQSGLGLCLTMASHRARYKHVDYGSRYMAACSVTAPIDGRFFRFRPGGHGAPNRILVSQQDLHFV